MDYRGGWRAAPLRGGSRLGPAGRRGRHRRGAACERALYALAAAMGTVGVALLVTIGRQQPALTASLLEERQRVGRTGAAVRPEGPLLNAALQEVEEALDTLDATPADGDDWVYEDPSAEKEVGATAEGEPAAEDGEAEDADYEERPLVPRDSEAAAEDASDPGVRARGAQQPKKAPAPPASRDLFPFIRLGDTNAALFNKSVGANADGKTLAFWHIPKTGGTYVENVLSGAGIKMGRELFRAAGDNVNVRPVLPKGPRGWMSPWHMPLPWMLEYIEKWAEFYDPDGKKPSGQNWYSTAEQADQGPAEGNTLRWWLDLDNVNFFCVVRDPYSKLISEYKWFHTLFSGNRGHKLDCSVESLNRFLVEQVPSGNFDNHMTPQVRYVYDSYDNPICKHVLHQENLEAELTALLLEYNLIDAAVNVASHAEALATGNWDQANQVAKNDMKSGSDCRFEPSMLTEETKRLIRERYHEDFEAFGYDDLAEGDAVASEPAEDPPQPGPIPTFWFSQEDDEHELANATAGAVPAAPGPSPCVPGAYAVLISGQVQRFVWQDEAGPLVAAADPACPPEVDVYIVLQQGEMGRVWSGAVPDAPYQAETTAENLRDWYRTRGARHVLVEFVSGADVRAFLDEAPFPKRRPGWRHSPESDYSGARYRNNLKMFYLRHLAFAAATASDRFYDGFTYWREDNFFYTPLPEALIPSAGPKPEVAVDANCGWWSYSDKVYATNPAGAGVLFDLTLDDFLAKMADYAAYGAPRGEWQTEAFLTDVMAAAGVTVTKREFHRTDVRYVAGQEGICVPGLYWGCTPDGYLNTALNAYHGLQCCSGDAHCAVSPERELMLASQRDWQPDAAKTLAPYRAPARPRAELPCGSRMHDGRPFLFQSPDRPDRKAFVCLNEKVGSTTWKLALLRAGPHTEFHNLTVSPHRAPAEPDCDEYGEDPAVPRLMMVRNPYSRLLSGYIDKCVDARATAVLPGNMGEICIANKDSGDPAAAFPAFVEAVINEDPDRLNGHFSLQSPNTASRHCHVDAGYDYYLPTEQEVHWYAPFVAALDLGEAVSTGWDISTRWWRNDGSECFYHPPGLGCDGAPLGKVRAGAFSGDSFHATGSDARLDEFYTPELARAVTEWAKGDLEEFGYPAWDGVDGAGYLRRISAPY